MPPTIAPFKRPVPAAPKRRRKVRRIFKPLALEYDLRALAKAVPASEWAKLPRDLNENLDHYLYGSPKKPVRHPRMS